MKTCFCDSEPLGQQNQPHTHKYYDYSFICSSVCLESVVHAVCVCVCVCWLDGCGVSYLYKQTLCSVSDKGLAAQWQKRDGVSELQATKLQLTPRERERNKDLRKRNNLGKFRITSRQSNKKKKDGKKAKKKRTQSQTSVNICVSWISRNCLCITNPLRAIDLIDIQNNLRSFSRQNQKTHVTYSISLVMSFLRGGRNKILSLCCPLW